MVSLTRPSTSAHGPRPMNPFRDWGGVAQLMRVAFQSEVTTASLPLLPDWAILRPVNGLIGVLEALGMDAPEQMLGYVWEEQGHIVGNATLGLSNSTAGIWLLSNVAVHPTYRRRGIARALVETALKHARQHGGKFLTLQVQSDNLSARQLYERLGFRTLEQVSEFAGANLRAQALDTDDTQFAAPTREQWAAAQALTAAHLPPVLKTYRHALAGLFLLPYQRSLLAQIGEMLRGVQQTNWCVVRDGAVVGAVVVQAQLSWGNHRIGVHIAPQARGHVEELVIARAAQHIQRFGARRALFALSASHTQLADALRRHGLRELRTLDLMAIQL